MQQQFSVSVGMPVYNGENYIRQALDSLLAQDHQDFELIISDNASTDKTPEICLEYAAKDSRIRFQRNEVNLGGLANFQRALDLSVADYFMWAAHDDIWEPTYISTLYNAIKSCPDVALSFSLFNSVDDTGKEITAYPRIKEIPASHVYQRLCTYILQAEHLGKANPFYGLMRKSIIQDSLAKTVCFLEKNVFAADMLFVFQVLSLGDLAVAPQTLFHKRISPSCHSHVSPTYLDWHEYFDGYQQIIKDIDSLTLTEKEQMNEKIMQRRRKLIFRYPVAGIKNFFKPVD